MQGFQHGSRLPHMGSGHDVLPNLIKGLEDAVQDRCSGIAQFLSETKRAIEGLASQARKAGGSFPGISVFDEAKSMYARCVLKEQAMVGKV